MNSFGGDKPPISVPTESRLQKAHDAFLKWANGNSGHIYSWPAFVAGWDAASSSLLPVATPRHSLLRQCQVERCNGKAGVSGYCDYCAQLILAGKLRATGSREPLPDPRCIVKGHLSRVCELGTKCCVVQHSEWRDNGQGPVPSVPAEIESRQVAITELWCAAQNYYGATINGTNKVQEQSRIRLHKALMATEPTDSELERLDAVALLADSTPTQEKPSGSK